MCHLVAHTILCIAECQHNFMNRFSILGDGEAFLNDFSKCIYTIYVEYAYFSNPWWETEIGKRRSHHMKSRAIFHIHKQREQPSCLIEASRPYLLQLNSQSRGLGQRLTSVDKEERDGSFDMTFLMHKMHFHFLEPINFNLCLEVWQLIQLSLVLAPIVAISPIIGQALDIGATVCKSDICAAHLVASSSIKAKLTVALQIPSQHHQALRVSLSSPASYWGAR